MSPGKGTPIRTVRINDDVWERAQRAAAKKGTTVSDAMRAAVEALAAEEEDGGAAHSDAP